MRRFAALATLAFGLLAPPAAALEIHVSGNSLVDAAGRPLVLHGVARSGTEYACAQGYGFFDGPANARSIRRMKSWRINAVRVPLNESCWLGINGVRTSLGGASYRRTIHAWVERLHAAGLYVVLDLHVAAPGTQKSLGIIPMADADHAPAFWQSVASEFHADPAVIFDLYNEPHDIGWDCWLSGCPIPGGGRKGERHAPYVAAGMQQLLDAVRSTGATQPVIAGGTDYARVLDEWLAHMPVDSAGQLAASEHTYGKLAPCVGACRTAIANVAAVKPVVVGELGETDCRHGYIDKFMPWADRRGISYIGWTWNATSSGKGGWTCKGGPSLIENFNGKPTRFGVGFRNHLRKLARSGR